MSCVSKIKANIFNRLKTNFAAAGSP